MNKRYLRKLWQLSALFLAILATAYLLKGCYYLLFNPIGAFDFSSRWKAQQYIYQGHYPSPSILVGSPLYDAKIGEANFGGYFGWSYFSSVLFVPPFPLEIAKIYFFFVNLPALLVVIIFTYQTCSRYGKSRASFGVISVLAISAHCTTLGVGQYGIILNAILILLFQSLQKGRDALSGILGGIALLKPNVTALYVLVLFSRKSYRAAIVMTLYIILASLSIANFVDRNPLSLIELPLRDIHRFAADGDSFVNVLSSFGLSVQSAIYLLMIVGMGVSFLLLRQINQITLTEKFAVASVVGRLWTYHRVYDNTMLFFLYIAILELAFRQSNPIDIFVLYLLGISLWIPASWTSSMPMQTAQYVIWTGSLVFLLARRNVKTTIASAHHA